MRAVPVHDIARPEADIVRHGAEVHAGSAANPMANVLYLVRAGLRGRRRISPRVPGRSIGDQIDPTTGLPPDIRGNVV